MFLYFFELQYVKKKKKTLHTVESEVFFFLCDTYEREGIDLGKGATFQRNDESISFRGGSEKGGWLGESVM